MKRVDLLAAILAAFAGVKGNMSEADWNRGMAIIETEYDCDLEAVERDLKAELRACELACRVNEKE